MSKVKDEEIARLKEVIAGLTAERILPPEPEVFKTYHVENDKYYEVSHSQKVVCDDCAFGNGELSGGFPHGGYCACGRSNSNNTPIGEYDWEDDSID